MQKRDCKKGILKKEKTHKKGIIKLIKKDYKRGIEKTDYKKTKKQKWMKKICYQQLNKNKGFL